MMFRKALCSGTFLCAFPASPSDRARVIFEEVKARLVGAAVDSGIARVGTMYSAKKGSNVFTYILLSRKSVAAFGNTSV